MMTRSACLLLLTASVAACGWRATPWGTIGPADSVELRVDGAQNEQPGLAVRGNVVVTAWIATTSTATTPPTSASNVMAAVSADGGATFGAPVRVNDLDDDVRAGGEQAPRVVLGEDGTLLIAWNSKRGGVSQIRAAVSHDRGATFAPAWTMHDESLTGARGWASAAAGAATLHVSWLDGRNAMAPGATPDAAGAHHMRQDVFHATITPDGRRVISEAPVAVDVCFCCKTTTAVGPDGRVFVAWRHVYPTNLRDIAVASSTDDGRTFGAPVRVSEDHWQIAACPEDGPSMAVDADGNPHIAWPTIVEGSETQKAIFYAVSTDAGRTFSPRRRIDTAGTGVAAHPQAASLGHRVAVVWDQTVNGDRSVWIVDPAGLRSPMQVSAPGQTGYYPVVGLNDRVAVVAWVTKADGRTAIRVARVP